MISYVTIYLMLLFGMFHPVHVSIVNMDINTQERRIDFSVRMFHDDLAIALYNEYHDYMFEMQDSASARDFTDEYVRSKLRIISGRKKELNYVLKDKEISDDSAIITYTCELPEKNLESLFIYNSIFLNLYSDQMNLVIINKDGNETGYTLTNEKKEIELSDLY